ncbi:prolipoprotein diacylglyceryl transferase [Muribacter muris]|uniref:Phosphatidylglycerol--prolipoprotein diacylglyceryl transferase n=1 Tax=Muribacter muris TaxID=67855 RepID=A0A4Y9JZ04_9PAST|nr:prolipoprotein diacylglyceryl transferase [Muribacter muris]MBF0785339.1 prolipoprotein diacylglyceryl transferase [Muribacter muris]MBF0826353.1 prolipoprotein diacylglyceryl transferase [Muribacter muris]TFV09737.1 prolipoprotein diacylglyceryl transferase [Muribacter muris]
MQEFIPFPKISPVIFEVGGISLHWYGVMYLLGFGFAYWLGTRRAKQSNGIWTVEQVDQLLFNSFLGVVLGGRIGDVFFYSFDRFLADPLYLFRIWEGGMSFHGGLIGVILAMLWTSRRQHRSFWQTADFVAPLIPFGLGMGRIGNFINDELWGRVTDVPWAVLFPNGGYLPRHPSQLYEAVLEGLVLFLILNGFIRKPRPTGSVAGLFLIGYGTFRFIVEYFREFDPTVNTAQDLITRGQLLSLPMIVLGAIFMLLAYRRKKS